MGVWDAVINEPQLLTTAYSVRGWSGRTTVLGGSGTDLAVYNPGATVPADLVADLRRRGRVTLLVAANHFHHLGIAAWRAAFPEALVVASPLAIPRLRGHGVEASGHGGIALPAGAQVLEPVGLRTGEIWLSLATGRGRCWIVGDAFFNVARTPRNPTGLMLWLTGTTPGLRVGTTFRRLAVGERAAYRSWLAEALATERPEILVPAHGEVLRDAQLPRRLATLAAARL